MYSAASSAATNDGGGASKTLEETYKYLGALYERSDSLQKLFFLISQRFFFYIVDWTSLKVTRNCCFSCSKLNIGKKLQKFRTSRS